MVLVGIVLILAALTCGPLGTAVRITVGDWALGYWNEIDAVELVGKTDS